MLPNNRRDPWIIRFEAKRDREFRILVTLELLTLLGAIVLCVSAWSR